MNKFLISILFLYILTTLVFIAVDWYLWFFSMFKTYKIGRWKDNDKWIAAVFKVGLNWLPDIPAVPTTSNRHLALWDILKGKYKRKSVQAWQTAGLLIGVMEFSKEKSKSTRQKTIDFYINKSGNWKNTPTNVDYAMLAYAFLKDHKNPEKIKSSMDAIIDLINNNIGTDGLIAYSGKTNLRFVDTLGLVCPFLVLYSNTYGVEKYHNLAFSQIDGFVRKGLYSNTWLPVHSYEIINSLPVGVYGWGRGTGWFIIGVLDTYLEMKMSDEKDLLKRKLFNIADYYLQFQRDDGGYGVFIQDKETYDSSATAIFAYFYASCYEISKDKKYFVSLEKSILKLRKFTRRSGELDYCQGDTINVGIFSQRFDIMPFAQGMTLRAFSIYKKYRSE